MTTTATIPLDKIVAHPDNVRRDAVADDEMVESIRSQGVLQDVGVVEDGDQYLLIWGHRRLDGARKAGLTSLTAKVLDHLTTRAMQIEAMLVENGRRVDLSPMEEAKAYEQLTFEGYKPKQIADATGRAVATVNARLRLNALGENTQSAVHSHQISLEDAGLLADLQDHPEILAEVEAAIGTNNFSWKLADARRQVEKEARWAETRAEFETKGLKFIDYPDSWNHTEGPCPASWHEDQEPDAWSDSKVNGPIAVITKVTERELSDEEKERRKQREHQDSEWEANRAAREERSRHYAAAQELRVAHVRSLFAGIKIPAATVQVIQQALVCDRHDLPNLALFGGVDIDNSGYGLEAVTKVGDQLAALKAPAIAPILWGTAIAAPLENILSDAETSSLTDDHTQALAYLATLEGSGYVLSDFDLQLRAEIEANLAEATAKETAA